MSSGPAWGEERKDHGGGRHMVQAEPGDLTFPEGQVMRRRGQPARWLQKR